MLKRRYSPIIRPRSNDVKLIRSSNRFLSDNNSVSNLQFAVLFDTLRPVDFLFGTPGDQVAGCACTTLPGVSGKGFGVGTGLLGGSGATSYMSFANQPGHYSQDLSIVWRGYIGKSGGVTDGTLVSKSLTNGGANTPFDLWVYQGQIYMVRSNATQFQPLGGNGAGAGTSPNVLEGFHTIGVTWTGDGGGGPTVKWYVDGVETDSTVGTTIAYSDNTQPITFSTRDDQKGTSTYSRIIESCFIWSSCLSAQEHLMMHLQPYRLFQPKRVPVGLSGGPPPADFSLTGLRGMAQVEC